MENGAIIAHYRIISRIGFGGMGEVYRAYDTEKERECALKVLNDEFKENSEVLARFKREYRAIASIDHPNVVKVYEFSADAGRAYIAMELLNGETLRSRLKKRLFSWRDALLLALEIADGLVAAHSLGITHRDLKPDNIYLTEEGGVKLLDFGLARVEPVAGVTEISSAPTIQKSSPGMLIGTVPYMSPEQLRGEVADQRGDIFSFGTILYEMLTGKNPFYAESAPETMAAILKEHPVRPSLSGFQLPPEMERVVLKALEKNPERRFQNALELLEALRRVQLDEVQTEDEPTLIPSAPNTQVATPSRRGSYLIVPFLLIALVTAAFFMMRAEREPAERTQVAVIDIVNETGEKELDGLSGLLITDLEQSRRLEVMTRARMFDVLRRLGKDVDRIDEDAGRQVCEATGVKLLAVGTIRKFGQVYSLDLKVLDLVGGSYIYAGKAEGRGTESIPSLIDNVAAEMRAELNESLERIQKTSRSIADVTTTNLEAYQHYFQGEQYINRLKWKEAEEQYTRAVSIDPSFVLAYYRLAYVLEWFGNPRAADAIAQAMRYIDRAPEKERYLILAEKAKIDGEFDKASEYYRQLLQLFPEEKEALWNIGDRAFHKGDYRTATDYLQQVLRMDPTFEMAINHLIWTYQTTEQYAEALKVAKGWVERQPSEDAYNYLGETYCLAGELQTAKEVYARALQLYPESVLLKTGMANVLIYLKDYEAAALQFAESSDRLDKRELLRGLAMVRAYQGRYREVRGLFDRILEIDIEKGDRQGQARTLSEIAFWSASESDGRKALENATRLKADANWYFYIFNYTALLLSGEYEQASLAANEKQLILLRPFRPLLVESLRALAIKDYTRAISGLEALCQKGYPEDKIFCGYYLALAYLESGNPKKAAERLEAVLKIHYNKFGYRAYVYPRALRLLGKSMQALGKREEAQEVLRELRELWRGELAIPSVERSSQ